MSAQGNLWTYPPVGQIAVMQSGARIAIWDNESDRPDCFTGQLLEEGANYARAVTVNLSVFWDATRINGIEPPTARDDELSLIRLEHTQ